MTSTRRPNTSPYDLFLALARAHTPRHRFTGDFPAWRAAALPAVLATLGDPPAAVDPNPRLIAEYQSSGLTCQRWSIDVCDGLAAVAVVNRPDSARPGERLPGILCWHGHTPAGKEPVMGNDSSTALRAVVRDTGTDYGRVMADSGYVTFAIDWMGRGDLDDSRRPNHRDIAGGRDWCNLYYLHATVLGMTPLGMNLAFGRVLVDVVAALPFVDAGRLGVMGLSGGGTMALWSALTDDRLKAAEIVCYSSLFADFAYRDLNYCGSQVTPGLFGLVDVPDLQGLLAPMPLLIDIGVHDECFPIGDAIRCRDRLQQIYDAAGAADNLQFVLFPGGHRWPGPSGSAPFFDAHLRGATERS